ncbi:MAG: hypothetical protein ACRCV7_04385 [Culicoidibacterales bacterium]
MKKLGTGIVILFSILIAFLFLNNAAISQGNLIKHSVINKRTEALVELKGNNSDERIKKLKELTLLAKENDVIVSYDYYHGDTVFDLYTSNIQEQKLIPQLNNLSTNYNVIPIDKLYNVMKEQQVISVILSGDYEETIQIAQVNDLIAKQVIPLQTAITNPMSYQVVVLLSSLILIMSIVRIIYRTKSVAIQKIHGYRLIQRMIQGYMLDYIKIITILFCVSVGYRYLLFRSYMVEAFSVYLEFIIILSIVLFLMSTITYCAVEFFNVREAIKNKLPKSFLSSGLTIYKFIISILTLSLAVSFGLRAQTAIDDVNAMKVYEQLGNYKAINYGEDLRIETMTGKLYEKEIYPILNRANAIYFDSSYLSGILESIRNGKISSNTLTNIVENKSFPVNNNYISQMVTDSNKEKYLVNENDPQIKVIASSKDKEKIETFRKDKIQLCNMLVVSDLFKCQNYDIQFIYYEGELEAVMPNPFLANVPKNILKYPVFMNFSQKANEDLGITKILSSDGFLDPIRVQNNCLTPDDVQQITRLMQVKKLTLVGVSSGYEDVIAQGKIKLQSAFIDLCSFLIASILLSVVIVLLYIEEYKKKIALEKFAGNTWYKRYGKTVDLIVWSWIVGFLFKLFFPIENVLFNVHEQTYNVIFWLTISMIIGAELMILLIVTRVQEHKAIATILKNE